DRRTILVNQVLGSPIAGGIARIVLRLGGPRSKTQEVLGPAARVRLGTNGDQLAWEGKTDGVRHLVPLRGRRDEAAWLWRVDVANTTETSIPIDAVFLQDLGLGARAFVTNNEAYASQYIDHYISHSPRLGPVLMSRQNLAQDGENPWVMHGCL